MRSESKRATASKPTVVADGRSLNPTTRRPIVDSNDADTGINAGAQAVSAVARDPGQLAPVTITGCLERNDETFRLRDTDGAEAPKARSWKSGFLKKRAASVALVDSAHQFRLPSYVGQRIAATGTLANREMQVHSVQRVAVSCS